MRKRFFQILSLLLLILTLTGWGLFSHWMPTITPSATGTPVPEGEELRVHFLDVGQADCALLECSGQTMLIDGGNVKDSSRVVAYLKDIGIEHLDYIICSHAHEDHVGGLSGPLNTCTVGAVYAPVTEYESEAFADFVKYTEKQGLTVIVPGVDRTFGLGEATVRILGPRREYEEPNDTSLVLRVDFGDTSFLFTGDMERTAEEDLLAAGCDLDADVLKVAHHGSDTSTGYVFLREVMPKYAVVSAGEDNSYEHPRAAVLGRLHDADVMVYRTDEVGTVVAVSDGGEVCFTTEREMSPESTLTESWPPVQEENMADYVGNRKSMVFHREDCRGLPAEHNRVNLVSREEALTAGYKPCRNCKP